MTYSIFICDRLALTVVTRRARMKRNRRGGRAFEIRRRRGGTRGEERVQQAIDDTLVEIGTAHQQRIDANRMHRLMLIGICQARNHRSLQIGIPRSQFLDGRSCNLDQTRAALRDGRDAGVRRNKRHKRRIDLAASELVCKLRIGQPLAVDIIETDAVGLEQLFGDRCHRAAGRAERNLQPSEVANRPGRTVCPPATRCRGFRASTAIPRN